MRRGPERAAYTIVVSLESPAWGDDGSPGVGGRVALAEMARVLACRQGDPIVKTYPGGTRLAGGHRPATASHPTRVRSSSGQLMHPVSGDDVTEQRVEDLPARRPRRLVVRACCAPR
jgi:hypothetical protein